MRKIRQNPIR